jgi:hypothetical protein
MLTALTVLAALVAAYVVFVLWITRQPIEICYYTVLSRVLRVLLPGMVAISLWTRVILLYPPGDPRGRLSVSGKVHELRGHVLNPAQWLGHPFLFPFMYAAEQLRCTLRYGIAKAYDYNKYEEQARAIAGEPSRVPPVTAA